MFQYKLDIFTSDFDHFREESFRSSGLARGRYRQDCCTSAWSCSELSFPLGWKHCGPVHSTCLPCYCQASMLHLPGCHCDPLYRPRCSARWGTWFSLGYEGHNMSWLSAGQWTGDAPWLREESAKANMCIFNKNSKNVIAQ